MAGEMGDMAGWVGKVTIEFVVLRPVIPTCMWDRLTGFGMGPIYRGRDVVL
jgi:hypothetical protein